VVAGSTPLETFTADIAALLDHLALDDIVLSGLSMGGQIVLECYRQFADRIRARVLADTFARVDTEEGRRRRRETADRLLADGMAGYADEALPTMIAPYNVEALPAVAAHVHAMMAAAPAAGAAAALRGRADRRDYTDLLGEISVPTLVVVGRDDELTPIGDAEDMHRRIPRATLAVVDGAGHLPNLEQPAAFNAALRDFLARIDTPQSAH
jgi:3-oxoadipate enol-lactonase